MFTDRYLELVRKIRMWMPSHFREGKVWFVLILACSLVFNMLLYALINPYTNGAVFPLVYVAALLLLLY